MTLQGERRPQVTLHYAQTLDGRIATRGGQSQWISGAAALTFAHRLRAAHDAVLVGIGTVLRDDPRLTVRLVEGSDPLRVVVDSHLRIPLTANVLAGNAAAGTLLATTEAAPVAKVEAVRARGAGVLVTRADAEGHVDLPDLLARLAGLLVRTLLVEGGAAVLTSFLRQGLVDRLVVCVAPKVLGRGIEGVGELGIESLAQALTLTEVSVRQLDADILVDARVAPRQAASDAGPPAGGAPARAVWFAGPRSVEVREEAIPPPGPREVRVRALLSAISHGTEMLVYRGEVDPATTLDLPTLRGSFAFPIKHGYASVGIVVAAGAMVTRTRVGERVFALHPHQSEYVLAEDLVLPLPEGLAPEAGVFAANLETAVNVLLDAPARLGETAVVFGQGVVGLLLTQLLRRSGAGRVIAVDPFPTRRALAVRLGADAALAPAEATPEQLRELTGGRGADLAYEASASPAALQQAVDAVAPGGQVVAVSWYGSKPVTLDLGRHFHRGRVRIVSSQVGAVNPALAPRWDRERRGELVRDLLPQLRLSELISHRFPLERAAEAYRLIDEHPEETVQVVLTY